MADIHQPHDSLFRSVFSNASEAAALLQATLPDYIRDRVVWTTLALVDGTLSTRTYKGVSPICSTTSNTPRPASLYRCIFSSNTSPHQTRGCACGSCGTVAESGKLTDETTRTGTSCARSYRWYSIREFVVGIIPLSLMTCFALPHGPWRGCRDSLTS